MFGYVIGLVVFLFGTTLLLRWNHHRDNEQLFLAGVPIITFGVVILMAVFVYRL